MTASLAFSGLDWWWLALAALVVLVPLAWLAVAPARAARDSRTLAVALALRTLGAGLLLIALLDPQWTSRRAVPGANQFAVVADNSQGLAVRDPGAALTRGEIMHAALVQAETGWLARLAETFQVRSYQFDRSLQRVREFATLDFTGDRSALGAALGQLRDRFAGQPLAGVLLLTDGNATDIPEPGSLDLSGLPPLYPVLVGEGPVADLRIDRVTVRQSAFDDAPVTVQVDAASEAIRAREAVVSVRTLSMDGSAPAGADPEAQVVQLENDGRASSATFSWRPAGSGVQFHEVTVHPQPGDTLDEATEVNNRRTVMTDRGRESFRLLYVGGRPGWDFKFLNRALLEDPQLQMVGLQRAARREPKFDFKGRSGEASNPMFRGFGADASEAPRYDQPVLVRVNTRDEAELRGGFPTTEEELFAYDAVILDDVEAEFFTGDQLALLRRFTADRGGGLLMLGGADSLESGGYAASPLAAALPVYLDRAAPTLPSGGLRWSLTREGWVQPWVRIRPEETLERARVAAMPPMLVAHALPATKPGATVLAEVEDDEGARFPALVAQRHGAGRVACLTLGDLWRWGLKGDPEQADLARMWRQIARWLVTDAPPPVALAVEPVPDPDSGGVRLRVTVRDRSFRPADLATVRLTVRRIHSSTTDGGPAGFQSGTLQVEPVAGAAGQFGAVFAGRDAGAYLAEADAVSPEGEWLGRAQAGWVSDPAAEEFRSLTPNRALLEELARRTGGAMVAVNEIDALVARLPSLPAPVHELSSRPIWHTPWVFALVLGCLVTEWIWRRWRGLP